MSNQTKNRIENEMFGIEAGHDEAAVTRIDALDDFSDEELEARISKEQPGNPTNANC